MLDKKEIQKLDSQQMLSSIEVLDKQCTDAWSAAKQIQFPQQYRSIDRIVLFGMGGSALGMHFIKTLFSDQLSVPIEIINDYQIPGIVNDKTLAILSSYSGTTEETLAASENILEKTQNVFVITTGGRLREFAEINDLPAYIFEPKFNPSKQPRMAVGYSVMGTCGALSALGFIDLTDDEVNAMAEHLTSLHASLGVNAPLKNNQAKQLAQQIHGRQPVIVSSEFLEGATHVFTNQTNENSKQFAVRFPIPELNHHLIEGFIHPRESLDRLLFVFINSKLYHTRNQARYRITNDVVKKNNIATTNIELRGTTKFNQAFELLLIGSYISLYLAILNNLDPSPIPNVDLLKDELKKA